MRCLACGKKFVPEKLRAVATICVACAQACRICGGKHTSAGLCMRHYRRWLRADRPPLKKFIAQGLHQEAERAATVPAACPVCGKPFDPYDTAGRPMSGCSPDCRRIMRRKNTAACMRRAYYRSR
jgi:hypothetical protein